MPAALGHQYNCNRGHQLCVFADTDMFVLHSAQDLPGLQHSVELEATVLVDGGEGVQAQMAIAWAGRGRSRAQERAWFNGAIGQLDRSTRRLPLHGRQRQGVEFPVPNPVRSYWRCGRVPSTGKLKP